MHWENKWHVKTTNNKASKKPHKPFNKKSPPSNSSAKKSKNSSNPSTWAWCNSKPKSTTKKRTPPKIRASSKNSSETETCTRKSSSDHKRTTRKFMRRLSTRKKCWKRSKINFLDRRKKSKNLTSKSQLWKRKEIPIRSRQHQPKPSTFMLEIKLSWEITSLQNSRNKTWKLNPNSKSNNLCMRQSGLTEILCLRNLQKSSNRKANTATGIAELPIRSLN